MTATPESALVERLRKAAKVVHLEPGRSPLEEAFEDAARRDRAPGAREGA